MKTELLDLLQVSLEEELALPGRLDSSERERIGTWDNWSARDLLSHIAAWKERQCANLEAWKKEQPLPVYGETEQENAAIFARYTRQTWDQVLNSTRRAQAHLVEYLEGMDEASLQQSFRPEDPNPRPIWRTIAGNGNLHPIAHLAQFYAQLGKPEEALRLNELSFEKLKSLDESPSWRGLLTYNLACYHALAGMKAEALVELQEALSQAPELTEFSKEDPDLNSLHEEPSYQALYATA